MSLRGRPAYYNEYDRFAAAWLRELIADGLIAPGDVDERSIEDVTPDDLAGYTQCHFFAGIGVWSLALRSAGWPDNRPIWTGSCPCQPFSAAGKGAGLADERHLWPALHWLIGECRPPIVIGEQVSSADGLAWLDVVLADLDQAGYTGGAVDTCAAGFGAPHIRQRLYWMGYTNGCERGQGIASTELAETATSVAGKSGRMANAENHGLEYSCKNANVGRYQLAIEGTGSHGRMADAAQRGHGEYERDPRAMASAGGCGEGEESEPRRVAQTIGHSGEDGRMADADGGNARAEREQRSGEQRQQQADGRAVERMADAQHAKRRPQNLDGQDGRHRENGGRPEAHGVVGTRGKVCGMADANAAGSSLERVDELRQDGDAQSRRDVDGRGDVVGLAHSKHDGHDRQNTDAPEPSGDRANDGILVGGNCLVCLPDRPGPTNGLWRTADWLYCRDDKRRPVEPGTFPLVAARSVRNRVGMLRGAGNALNVAQAEGFVRAMMTLRDGLE